MLLVATAAASCLVLAATMVAATFFAHLNSELATQPMSVIPKPPAQSAGENILGLGSQTRVGQGPGFGNDPGTDLSDTAMLIHLNAARTKAVVVSIPRDLLVFRPPCRERVGGNAIIGAQAGAMFDSAMNLGGPACAVATVEQMSGIRVDHFIRVDFNGFRMMTDALGGVPVCVPSPGIHDWRSHLDISAGLHVISGDQALAFVRDRHGIGNGGDLDRIKMQQMFVSSLIRKVMSDGTLTNPMMAYRLADSATRSLTTDPGLGSVQALLNLGASLRSLKLTDITFVTLPNMTDPSDTDRLLPQEPQADAVWQLLREDVPWTGQLPDAGAAKHAATQRNGKPHSGTTAGATGAHASPQSRNASENICRGLPQPAIPGELGR